MENSHEFNISDAVRQTRQVPDEPDGFSDNLHLMLSHEVRSGKYDSYMDAFMGFVVENDIDLNTHVIAKYVSPALKQIIYNEALERGLLHEPTGSSPKLCDELFR